MVDLGAAPSGRLVLCQARRGAAKDGGTPLGPSGREGQGPPPGPVYDVLATASLPSEAALRFARLAFTLKPLSRLSISVRPNLPSTVFDAVRGVSGDVVMPAPLSVVPTFLKYPPGKPPKLWSVGQVCTAWRFYRARGRLVAASASHVQLLETAPCLQRVEPHLLTMFIVSSHRLPCPNRPRVSSEHVWRAHAGRH